MVKMSTYAHEVYKTPKQREASRAVGIMRIRWLELEKYKILNCPPGISFIQSFNDYFLLSAGHHSKARYCRNCTDAVPAPRGL